MKFSEDNIQQFFQKLSETSKETSKSMQSTNETATKLLAIEVKSAKAEQKRKRDEQKHKNRLAQLTARREREMKGPLQETIASLKQDKGSLSGWLLAALGLAGLVAGGSWLMSDDPNAKAIRDAIGEKAKELADWIKTEVQKAIDEGIADIVAKVNQFRDAATRGTGAGGRSSPGQNEAAAEDAAGSVEEKIEEYKRQLSEMSLVDRYVFGKNIDLEEKIYRLETGEDFQYGPGFLPGGAMQGEGPRQILSGPIQMRKAVIAKIFLTCLLISKVYTYI